MAKIKFPDGQTLEAPTWEELEDRLRLMQFEDYSDQTSFREAMQRRAEVWSDTEIMINGDSQDFMYELSRAQLLDVIPDFNQNQMRLIQ